MGTSKLVAQWLIFITGLTGAAALIPILNFTHIASPASLSCVLSHYTFPAIRSMCAEYLRYIWILFTRQQDHYSLQPRPAALITPRNLFLLINLIIFFLFASLHLQQHAAACKQQKRRIRLTENLINDHQAVLQNLQRSSLSGEGVACRGASIENLDHHSSLKLQVHGRVEESCEEELASVSLVTANRSASMERLISEAAATEALLSNRPAPEFPASMAAGYTESTSSLATSESSPISQGSGAVDRDGIDGSNIVEKIVLEEDGQLRLIEESSTSSKTCTLQTSSEDSNDRESATNGSDCGKIVLEEDGRLRLMDRPQLPASLCKPVESHSGDNYNNHKDNYSSDEFNKCISPNNHSFNNSYTNLSDKLTGNYDISDNTKVISNNYDINDNTNNIGSYDISDNTKGISHNYDMSDNTKVISHNYDIGDDTKDISHNNYGFNKLYTNLSLVNYGESNIDSQDLKRNGTNSNIRQEAHRSKSSSDVLSRKVSRPKVQKYESLDATWRAITHSRDVNASSSSRDHKPIISRQNSRHEFKPSSSSSSRGGKRALRPPPVRREPSLGPEELNSKVESFIARFNEQIRIQRQQSILSYMQMVDRGA